MKNTVKFLRVSQEFNMTQEELAEALDVSRSTIYHVEKGGDIKGSLMLKISHFFNKDPREIFFTDDVV